MIETTQTVVARAPINGVWDYVREIDNWANLMPGLQDCEIADEDNSRWTLKVGAGALVRTVRVAVHVEKWDGPGYAAFKFKLEGDPVAGQGTYLAKATSSGATEISLGIQVRGSGPMAPMWETMGKPLLPSFASAFAEQLRDKIEENLGIAQDAATAPIRILARFRRWLRKLWCARSALETGEVMIEANKQLVRTFIEAFSEGDAATAETCLAADAMTVAKGFGKLSGERPHQLILATTAAFRDLIPTGLQPRFISFIAEGDRVAVEFEGNSTLVNGEDYNNQYCMVFTLADGKIKSVNEYYCTILADEKILPLLANVEKQRSNAAG